MQENKLRLRSDSPAAGGARAAFLASLLASLVLIPAASPTAHAAEAALPGVTPAGQPLLALHLTGFETVSLQTGLGFVEIGREYLVEQISIFKDRRVVAILTRNDFFAPDQRSRSNLVAGRAAEASFERLLDALLGARIAFERGGCQADLGGVEDGPQTKLIELYPDGQVTWHGRGNRLNSFRVAAASDIACSDALQTVLRTARLLVDQAARSPEP